MSDTKTARAQLQRFYALTDQLTVALDTLDERCPVCASRSERPTVISTASCSPS